MAVTDTSRTYTGWKAGLLIVLAIIVVFSVLNIVTNNAREKPRPDPGKVVVTTAPAP